MLSIAGGLSRKVPDFLGPDLGLDAHFFAELSYEVRDFPSLSYTLPSDIKTLPPDLPRSLGAGGFVLSIGFEITFPKKKG
jgi:hypothetical protein